MISMRKVLELPWAYRLFRTIVGGPAAWQRLVEEYIRPQQGQRILDLGCGAGDVLSYLPSVSYVGIDISSQYIQAARARFGHRGEFHCRDATQWVNDNPGVYDVVMANGLFHHCSDDQARDLFALAAKALKPSGRLVTYDGCYVPEQSRVARLLLRMDRGQFVRTSDGYRLLAEPFFAEVQSSIRHDLLRIPYTHLIMTCQRPIPRQLAYQENGFPDAQSA